MSLKEEPNYELAFQTLLNMDEPDILPKWRLLKFCPIPINHPDKKERLEFLSQDFILNNAVVLTY